MEHTEEGKLLFLLNMYGNILESNWRRLRHFSTKVW